MSYQIKIKSGFFKTLKYEFKLSEDEIMLIPSEVQNTESIMIPYKDVLGIGFTRESNSRIEFEIITQASYYFGYLINDKDFDSISSKLMDKIGYRIQIG